MTDEMTKYGVDPGELTKEAQGVEEPGMQPSPDACICGSADHKAINGPGGTKMCPEALNNLRG